MRGSSRNMRLQQGGLQVISCLIVEKPRRIFIGSPNGSNLGIDKESSFSLGFTWIRSQLSNKLGYSYGYLSKPIILFDEIVENMEISIFHDSYRG